MNKSNAERNYEVAKLTAQACVAAWEGIDMIDDAYEETFENLTDKVTKKIQAEPLTATGVLRMVEVYAAARSFKETVLREEGRREHLSLRVPTALSLLEAAPSALYDAIKASAEYLEDKIVGTPLPSQGQEE